MRKGRDRGEKKWGGGAQFTSGDGEKRKKIKTFLVATNVIASKLPECRPTGTPTARAKKENNKLGQPKIQTPF